MTKSNNIVAQWKKLKTSLNSQATEILKNYTGQDSTLQKLGNSFNEKFRGTNGPLIKFEELWDGLMNTLDYEIKGISKEARDGAKSFKKDVLEKGYKNLMNLDHHLNSNLENIFGIENYKRVNDAIHRFENQIRTSIIDPTIGENTYFDRTTRKLQKDISYVIGNNSTAEKVEYMLGKGSKIQGVGDNLQKLVDNLRGGINNILEGIGFTTKHQNIARSSSDTHKKNL
jgi:hypothetical protein